MDDKIKIALTYKIINKCDIQYLQHLVSNGYIINHERFLTVACIKGHLEIVKYILSLNTVYNINSIIFKCIKYKQLHILIYILDITYGDNIKQKSLNLCIKNGYLDMFKLLIEKKKNPYNIFYLKTDLYKKCVNIAIINNQLDIVKYLVNCYFIEPNTIYSSYFISECIKYNRKIILEYFMSIFKNIKIDYNNIINKPYILKFFIEKGYNIPEKIILQTYKYGYINIVKTLIDNGYQFNQKFLKETCSTGCVDILKELINNGADITIENNYCLKYACLNGHLEVVKLLFSNGVDIYTENGICLDMACLKGNLNIVVYLVSKGVKLKEESFTNALKSNKYDIISYLLQKGLANTKYNELLVLYVQYNNIELVKLLIEIGANVTTQDNSPIIFSVRLKNLEMTEYLISKGAKIDEYLLTQAINSGSLEITKLVIENSVNLKDENYEFVKLPIYNRYWDIVEYILNTYYGGIYKFVETCEIYNLVSEIKKKYKLESLYRGPITETTEKECGICLQEMNSSTEELLIQCLVCKKCTHKKCSNIWNKNCIYCRN